MAAGAAIDIYGKLKSGSAQRRAADNRATALKSLAERKMSKARQQSELTLTEGGMAQTSQLTSLLGKGISENASFVGSSLDEISKRAQFQANQTMSDANFESQSLLSDAADVSKEGRDAQRAGVYGSISSILGAGSSYLQGKYGKDAFSKALSTNYTKGG